MWWTQSEDRDSVEHVVAILTCSVTTWFSTDCCVRAWNGAPLWGAVISNDCLISQFKLLNWVELNFHDWIRWGVQKVYFCMMKDHYIMDRGILYWWGYTLSTTVIESTKPSWELLCQLCSSIYMHTKFSYKSTNFHTMKMSHLELYI